MSPLPRFSALLAAGMMLAAEVLAQPAGSSDAGSPASVPARRERGSSSSVSSALAASMPRYNPPPKPKPEDENVDLREIDKPRNGIIRLPKYTVQQRRPPVFRERDVYTSGGLADLAKRRYLTPTYRLLNSVYIPFFTASPEEHALAMYAEDERLNNMSDLKSTARDVGVADPADGAYIKRVTDETYMRRSDFGYRTPEPGRRP